MIFFKPRKGKKEEKNKNLPQNPKILEVNLIKGEVKIDFDWGKNISVLVITLLILSAFMVEIYFGLNWWGEKEKAQAETLNLNIAKTNAEIVKVKSKADEALIYKEKSIAVSHLLANHVYWSNFFSWLEKNTLSTVRFDSFSGDTKGVYTLTAKALSFSEASWQVKAFLNDPLVKKAEIDSVNFSSGKDKANSSVSAAKGVDFTLNFELNPDIFKK